MDKTCLKRILLALILKTQHSRALVVVCHSQEAGYDQARSDEVFMQLALLALVLDTVTCIRSCTVFANKTCVHVTLTAGGWL
jgi:hypothetical protein